MLGLRAATVATVLLVTAGAAWAQAQPVDPIEQAAAGAVQVLINTHKAQSSVIADLRRQLDCWEKTGKRCAPPPAAAEK